VNRIAEPHEVRCLIVGEEEGRPPSTARIDELLDERTAVMEMEMEMVCSGKGPQTPN